MSEYQYYEFLAVDRPLDKAAQQALREISSRAKITATSFTNHYDFGELHGEPLEFMEQWFDLHLYLANWGTRRLMIRAPRRLLNEAEIEPFVRELDWVNVQTSGDNVIIDILRDEEPADEDWDDGSGRLATMAPLRADVLSGDLRLFYLLWLTAVQEERLSDDAVEPLPGIGPLTDALESFADFFSIDNDLVQAAAEQGEDDAAGSKDTLRESVAAIAEDEKTSILVRLVEGDSHVVDELRLRIRNKRPAATPSAARRTVGELRARAQAIGDEQDKAEAERQEAERRRQAEATEKARRARLDNLRRRGERAWSDVELEIARRNANGYDQAASLLSDLQALAVEEGTGSEFAHRLDAIRARHESKRKFIERLSKLGVTASR